MLPHSKKTFFTCIHPRKACFHSSVYSVSIKVLKRIIFHGLFLVHQIRFTAQICYKVQLWYNCTDMNLESLLSRHVPGLRVKTKSRKDNFAPNVPHNTTVDNTLRVCFHLQRNLLNQPLSWCSDSPLIFADSFVRECFPPCMASILVHFLWRFYVIFTDAWLWVFCQYYYIYEVLIRFSTLFVNPCWLAVIEPYFLAIFSGKLTSTSPLLLQYTSVSSDRGLGLILRALCVIGR